MKISFLSKAIKAFCCCAIIPGLFISCGPKEDNNPDGAKMEEVKNAEKEFNTFALKIENEMKPVYNNLALAYFEAAVSGKEEDFKKSENFENMFNKIMANKDYYKQLKAFKDQGFVKDDLQSRRLDRLFNTFHGNQVSLEKLEAMTKLQSEIQKKYNSFRTEVAGKKLSDNDVEETLRESKDSKVLKATWLASKEIGPIVANDIIQLVKMRNEVATELGYNNYHEMSLSLSDQKPEDVAILFDELDDLTRAEYTTLKEEIDNTLAHDLKIKPKQMQAWHYQNRYFQEAPVIYDVDLDKYYKGKDLVALTGDYFKSIGMPIDKMIEKSDLFEKPGKNQHAFCIDIDRDAKDVRILCNVKENSGWMNTMLHEYGHGVYAKYHDKDLPWSLKEPAHTFTTEAIAMLFGRMASNPQWMQDMVGISEDEKIDIAETAQKILKLEQLVFSRWAQVMYRFEKGMYGNPDQDLNKLWWDLVESYQMMKRPEGRNQPDWATKTHIATSPCYYHNYLLGELLASQLYFHISKNIVKKSVKSSPSFYNNQEVGKFLIDNVFGPGAKYYWNDMIEKATGEKLTPKYYAKQFVK